MLTRCFEGKAVTLQALLEAAKHGQGQQPDVCGEKRFLNPGRAVVQVQLQAKFTQKASYNGTADLAHLDCRTSMFLYTLTLYHPLKIEDEMGLLHDFGSTLQRLVQPSHRLLNKT